MSFGALLSKALFITCSLKVETRHFTSAMRFDASVVAADQF